ncbi:lipopolysaccharide kinase InaA family protein [Gemmatimonas sp.]|uniref:lipopolysaccharide kinase InaA family protein n=1 Tax=Gemmatimonas sp. TaxID=1962908 RepID=UPI00286B3EBD|nr:lipopolysaccharide kinase InaA family protein [Gemmatimonas sp.]
MSHTPLTRAVGRADVTGIPTAVDDLVEIVREHDTLYDWAAEQPQPRAMRGRAPVYVATLPECGIPVVVRHGWHGGLLAPLTADRFRRPTRAPVEMERSAALRAAGVPTTEVLGFARYPASFGLCHVDVVTRLVADAADLGMVLAGLAPFVDCETALASTQRLLIQLASHGVIHPDLNVKNILLRPTAGGIEALIIDVDVVRWDPSRSPDETMRANVARLTRSVRKWRTHFGCDVTDARIAAFTDSVAAELTSASHPDER